MLGIEPEALLHANGLAIRVWNLLSNGMGGLDWAGLPLAVELLGITDVEALLEALLVIKTHRPDTQDAQETQDPQAMNKQAIFDFIVAKEARTITVERSFTQINAPQPTS